MDPKNWRGDKRVRFKITMDSSFANSDTKVCVVTRKYQRANGQMGQYAWMHFEGGTFHGTIENKTRLRKLAKAILRAIGEDT